jgi:hypothetical protein
VEKRGTARQATDDSAVRSRKDALIDTHRPIIFNTYCFPIATNGYVNMCQCYVVHTLPLLFTTQSNKVMKVGKQTIIPNDIQTSTGLYHAH